MRETKKENGRKYIERIFEKMNRRLFVLLWGLGFGWGTMYLCAQQLTIRSCSIQKQDSTAIKAPRYDINDNIAAVVVFQMNGNQEMEFRGNIIGQSIKEDNRYIVYVADKTKWLHIYCSGYIPTKIDFTNYTDSGKGVLGGKTYQVSILGDAPMLDTDKKKNYEKGSNMLVFNADVPLRKVIVDGEEWNVTGNTAKRLVPFGEYHYEIQADSYNRITGDVEVKKTLGSQVVKLKFKK